MFCAPSLLLLLRNEFAKPDRIRPVQSGQDQTCSLFSSGMLACDQFSVTNLGNLNKIRHNQGFPKLLAEGCILDRIRHDQS